MFLKVQGSLFGRKINKKRCRNTMRNRNRLFHVFLLILDSILEPKVNKKRQRNDIEIGLEFVDEIGGAVRRLAAGAEVPGTKNSEIPERIRREPDL